MLVDLKQRPSSVSRNPKMDARTLVLNSAPADFHPDTHVALGPWCFFKAEEIYPEWEKLLFVDPFENSAERAAAAEACRALSHALVQRISAEMNRQYGIQRSRAYWHVVLMDWVLHVVMISWRLWSHVEAFKAVAGSEELRVSLPSAEFPRLEDTWQLVHACYDSPEFRDWILGLVVRRLAPANWTLLETGKAVSFSGRPLPERPARNGLVEEIAGLRPWHKLALSLLVRLAPKRKARFGPLLAGSAEGFPQAFLGLLDLLLHQTRPDNLGNQFRKLATDAVLRNYLAGRIYVTFVSPHFDRGNVARAEAVEAGERVINVQHGGLVQGGAEVAPLSVELEYCYDTYITWGWTEHRPYPGRYVALPNPYLRMLANRPRRPTRDIVFAGTIMPPFNPRFDYCPNPLEYRCWKSRFISSLAKDARASLVYRPYKFGTTLDDFEWLKRRFEWLREWQGSNFTAGLPSFRLVILDHPSTTFAFAMAADVPTIGFWDQSTWLMSAVVVEKFEPLKRVGILFDSPEKAAEQINKILPNVETWWRDPERQRARKEWCRNFAWADRWWFWYWAKALATV